MYYIYILECSNNSFYTGYTRDMVRRYREHVAGSPKCKYTRSFPPKRIAACWRLDVSLSEVLKIERAIKRLSRAQKTDLIANPKAITMLVDASLAEVMETYLGG